MTVAKPIDKLDIEGFKSIQSLNNFEMRSINVLIGANGSGKSNFVSYFKFLNELANGRLQVWLQKQGGIDRVLTFGQQYTTQIKSSVTFGRNRYDFTLEPTVNAGATFTHESIFFNGPFYGPKTTDLGSGHSEAILNQKYQEWNDGSEADYCFSSITSWKIFHFHDTSETARVKWSGALHDNEYLRSDASNLAAYLYKLKNEQPEVYQEIRGLISLAIPFFDDFVLRPGKLDSGEEMIALLWKQKDSDYPFWPSQLSDGSIRFICLVTALLQPTPPSTIIIDEPELGLHPYAITLLGALIRSACSRMQVVVSTQSVSLLNQFEAEDIVVVDRVEGASKFSRLDTVDLSEWLEDYSVGELWEKNIFGGRPAE